MRKTEQQLVEEYLRYDDFYHHLYGDMKVSYRHAASNTFEFARYRLASRIRELGRAMLEALRLR